MMNTQTKNSKQKQSITTISGLDIETSSTLIHIVYLYFILFRSSQTFSINLLQLLY